MLEAVERQQPQVPSAGPPNAPMPVEQGVQSGQPLSPPAGSWQQPTSLLTRTEKKLQSAVADVSPADSLKKVPSGSFKNKPTASFEKTKTRSGCEAAVGEAQAAGVAAEAAWGSIAVGVEGPQELEAVPKTSEKESIAPPGAVQPAVALTSTLMVKASADSSLAKSIAQRRLNRKSPDRLRNS